MKRYLIFLMVFSLLLVSFPVSCLAEEGSNIDYNPDVLVEMDMTADEWCADEDLRVIFVLCTILDCADIWTKTDIETVSEALTLGETYVTYSEGIVSAYFFGLDGYTCYMFRPEVGAGVYLSSTTDLENKELFMMVAESEGLFDSYWLVDGDTVSELIDEMTAE